MTTVTDMARWSLRWGNPDTEPPGPGVLAAVLVPRGAPCPEEVMRHWSPGCGYAVCWELVSQKPIRRWSPEARARVRRRNLANRLQRKVPLFAQLFYEAELEKRPDYFAGDY